MTDEITQADIKSLVDALNELVQGMKETDASTGGSGSSGSGSSLSSRSSDKGYTDIIGRENKDLEKKLKLLKEEQEYRGTLSAQQDLEQKQLQARLDILKLINEETSPEQKDAILKGYDDLVEAQKEMNKDLERGAGKFELLSTKMFKVTHAAESLQRHIPTSAAEIATFSKGLVDSVKSGKIFIDITKKMIGDSLNLSVALEKANAALAKRHGLMQEGYGTMSTQGRVIRSVERDLALMGVKADAAAAAQGALIEKMSSFSQLSKTQKDDLTKQSALMKELGVDVSTTSEIFDKATKSLGMGAGQMAGLAQELKDTADSLGLPFRQVSQDFNLVATQLSFYGEDVMKVFKGLEKQSKATGLSMSTLLKIGGDAFDTFDGAATKVGRLNAILGGPYLNSIDMLNASEEERLELLTSSMDASGKMYGDLGKYEQKAIADALGVSTEEANRLFGNLTTAEELDIVHKEKMAETARKAQTAMDKLANAFNSLLITMDPVLSAFEAFAELVSKTAGTPMGKLVMQIGMGVIAVTGLAMAFGKARKAYQSLMLVKKAGGVKAIVGRVKDKLLGTNPMQGPALPKGGLPGAKSLIPDAPAKATTSKWDSFTKGIKKLAKAVKGTWKEMLAFGAAMLMIGGGIYTAALGLTELVKAFDGMTNAGWALGAVTVVMGGFVAMLWAMIPAIEAIGLAAYPVAGPLIALGFAFLLMGGGIALAALGMAQLVKSFKGLNGQELTAAGIGIGIFSAAIFGLVSATMASTTVLPVLGGLAGVLLAVGAAAALMGLGVKLAAAGLVSIFKQAPNVKIFASALMGIGSAAPGLVATAAALGTLSIAVGVFSAALFTLRLKKLEALTEFNKSATLTVDNVHEPDTNRAGRKATEKRMDGAAGFPFASEKRIGEAVQAYDSGAIKPIINFKENAIIVKIGETELTTLIIEVLEEKGVSFNNG